MSAIAYSLAYSLLSFPFVRSAKFWLTLALLVLAAGAALLSYRLLRPPQPQTNRHPLTGYVLEITPEMNRIFVRNADIPGTMASMVMDYRVKDAATLTGLKPGDAIQATMVPMMHTGWRTLRSRANIDLSDDRARKFSALAKAK